MRVSVAAKSTMATVSGSDQVGITASIGSCVKEGNSQIDYAEVASISFRCSWSDPPILELVNKFGHCWIWLSFSIGVEEVLYLC